MNPDYDVLVDRVDNFSKGYLKAKELVRPVAKDVAEHVMIFTVSDLFLALYRKKLLPEIKSYSISNMLKDFAAEGWLTKLDAISYTFGEHQVEDIYKDSL